MRQLVETVKVDVLLFNELTETEKSLIRRAVEARLHAQAPYSNYWVGASLMTLGRKFFDGCNVENVNWSETGHAEEVAHNNAVSALGPFRMAGMAIVGAPEGQGIVWPPREPVERSIERVSDVCPSCGHCLQIIAENCFDKNGRFDPTVPLLGYNGRTGEVYRTTIGSAYPMPFLPQHLGVNYTKDHRFINS